MSKHLWIMNTPKGTCSNTNELKIASRNCLRIDRIYPFSMIITENRSFNENVCPVNSTSNLGNFALIFCSKILTNNPYFDSSLGKFNLIIGNLESFMKKDLCRLFFKLLNWRLFRPFWYPCPSHGDYTFPPAKKKGKRKGKKIVLKKITD